MALFQKLFGAKDNEKQPELKFGRYTDSNKKPEKTTNWNNARQLFTDKKYMDSFEEFLKYLRDDDLNNVIWERNGNSLNFEISQGSKVIKGIANEEKLIAECEIARCKSLNVAVMRKLMNENFRLQYTRFALNNDCICYKFDSLCSDASPNKLYYSLKELAIQADKQDDLLISEFAMLEAMNIQHIQDLPMHIKEVKLKYLKSWISQTIGRANQLDEDRFSGGITYLLLALVFRIDYLIKPEGSLMYALEEMQTEYFKNDNLSFIEKNRRLKEALLRISEKPDDEVMKSFYNSNCTFGLMAPATHKQVYDFVLQELSKTKWYIDNHYPDIEMAVYEYIAGYSLFNFGMHKPSIALFHLFFNVLYPDFFSELGVKQQFMNTQMMRPERFSIENRIKEIVKDARKEFPKFDFLLTSLDYSSPGRFAATFLNEITYLNYSK